MLCQFDVRDFGAVGDGHTLATGAIEKAVAAAATAVLNGSCSISGGGASVLVTGGGRYLTGAFSLATGVILHLSGTRTTLVASTAIRDYPPEWWNWDPALVDTRNASYTGIVGDGAIDGQAPGPYWSTGFDPLRAYFIPRTWAGLGPKPGCVGECRPKLVRFTDCQHVRLSGCGGGMLQLRNSPDWTMLFRRSSNVSLQRMNVTGDTRWPNNDGVDFESCNDSMYTGFQPAPLAHRRC